MRWHDNGLQGLTYDDVLIRPAYSDLKSRQDCNYTMEVLCLPLAPIVVANMKTIATVEMTQAIGKLGVTVPSHRFQDIESQISWHNKIHPDYGGLNAGSVGLNERRRVEGLSRKGIDVLFLELAHCDSRSAVEEVKWLNREGYFVIAGNVATADACKRLFDAGANMVKVGIGPGAVCTTRLVTGCGVPQFSAVAECAPTGPIIADGGIKYSGDIIKALAAGAEMVMIGSLFAGTEEAAGARMRGAGGKIYYGMASREAGKVTSSNVPEGIAATVPYAGSAEYVARELLAGVRQGMAIIGARTLQELREKAVFQRVSPATLRENQPHILERS
jgi:IMP dehydrogenase